jgi:hypothetical protein
VAERFGRRISDLKAPGAAPERRTRAAEAVLA